MPPIPSRPHVPIIGADPVRYQGMTIIVVVRCQQCEAGEDLALVNAQPATCPNCGASVHLNSVSWDKSWPGPKIDYAANRPLLRGPAA